MKTTQKTTHTHQIIVTRGEKVLVTVELDEGSSAVIGRSPAAQLAINDPRLSRMHAMLWVQGGAVWVRDLGSTNGTLLNGKRIDEPLLLPDAALLQVGGATIQLRDRQPHNPPPRLLWLEEEQTGLRRAVSAVPLTLPDGSTLRRTDDRVRLERPCGGRELAIGEGFDAGDQHWRLVDTVDLRCETDVSGLSGLPYTLSPAPRGRLHITHPSADRGHTIASVRRVRLMRTLAENLLRDRAKGHPREQQGWTADDDLGLAVWGAEWVGNGSNRLNVLIHRIRRALTDAGLDPECIQKQRGAARLWIQNIDLRGQPSEAQSRGTRNLS